MYRRTRSARHAALRTWRWAPLPIVALAACARPVESRSLASGATVRSLVAVHDTSVILVYRPSDVFLCNGSLQPWLEWGRRNPGRFALVFTRPPSEAERIQLANFRIHPAGVLERSTADRLHPPSAPVELLMVRGSLVATQHVIRRQLTSPLLRKLTASPRRPPPIPSGATLSGGKG
jgi:hypothetical protein